MSIHRTCLAILVVAACVAGEAGPAQPDQPGAGQPGQPGQPGMPPGMPPPFNHRPAGLSPGFLSEEMFKAADTDGDGKVTQAELAAYLEKRHHEERARQFDAMDANHDGSLSKDEFVNFEPPAPPGKDGKEAKRRPGPDPEEMFKRLDKNGDGVITADEVAHQRRDKKDKGDGPHPPPPPPAEPPK